MPNVNNKRHIIITMSLCDIKTSKRLIRGKKTASMFCCWCQSLCFQSNSTDPNKHRWHVMKMLDFKDFFKVYFCKLNNFGSVLGNCVVSSAKLKKSLTTNTTMKPDTIKKSQISCIWVRSVTQCINNHGKFPQFLLCFLKCHKCQYDMMKMLLTCKLKWTHPGYQTNCAPWFHWAQNQKQTRPSASNQEHQ